MKKLLFPIFFITLFACTPKDSMVEQKTKSEKILKVTNYSQDELTELQNTVKNGHQPWRLEKNDVIISFLIENGLIAREEKDYKFEMIDENQIRVFITNKPRYLVFVKQFESEDGIWFVEKVDDIGG
jgi:hypothetical protein